MRYFLIVLAIVLASFGHTQVASAQACTGFALLKDGDQYVDMGGGRALVDNRCYQRALCIGGTISSLGDNLYGCFVVPPCEGTANLSSNAQVTKTEDDGWSLLGSERVFCDVSCPAGQELENVSGSTYQCKSPAPTCSGVGNLTVGQEIWKQASNMWKTKDGQNTYCSVRCPTGTTLTHLTGDTHVCQPDPIDCQAFRDQYDLIPNHSWGTTPADQRAIWSANDCDNKVEPVNCEFMKDHYGIVGGQSWGTAPWHVANYWNSLNCAEEASCQGNHKGNLPSGAVKCADQNGTCWAEKGDTIYYGANQCYAKKTATGDTRCTDHTFGDPIRGVRKACFVK